MMQLTTCPTLINTTTTTTHQNPNYTSPTTAITTAASMATTTTVTTRLMDPKLMIKTHHDLSLFISPHTHTQTHRENGFNIQLSNTTHHHQDDRCLESDQTLQLFPIRNGGRDQDNDHHHNNIITNQQHKETEISTSEMNAPNQFIEFLPLKN
jgi:hypothetical protein